MTEYNEPLPPKGGGRPNRAQRHFLSLTRAEFRGWPQESTLPPTLVYLTWQAQQRLFDQLYSPGQFRSGALFGTRQGDIVSVEAAVRGAPPHRPMPSPHTVFDLDPSYLLAWSEALSDHGQSGVDWIGHWVIQADNALPSVWEQHPSVRLARRAALLDEVHFLLFVGQRQSEVCYEAVLLQDGESVPLAVKCLRGA